MFFQSTAEDVLAGGGIQDIVEVLGICRGKCCFDAVQTGVRNRTGGQTGVLVGVVGMVDGSIDVVGITGSVDDG